MIAIPALNGDLTAEATGVSADGSAVVGFTDGTSTGPGGVNTFSAAFHWSATTGTVAIAESAFPASKWSTSANGVSSDGSVIVGDAFAAGDSVAGFRWTANAGAIAIVSSSLQDINDHYADATAVSADGTVIAGAFDGSRPQPPHNPPGPIPEAYRWTSGTGAVGLGYIPGLGSSNWLISTSSDGISADGSTVIGTEEASPPGAPSEDVVFYWTAATGMVALAAPTGYSSSASGTSGDGSIIVGAMYPNGNPNEQIAMIWDAANGIRSLQGVLVNEFGLGAQLNGWTLTRATAITPDGKTIVGNGIDPQGHSEGWIAHLSANDTVVFTEPPAKAEPAGKQFPVQVTVDDSNGNADLNYNGPVTIALANNPSGANLGGSNLMVDAVNGIATFPDLSIDEAGIGYTLKATDQNGDSATTDPFNVPEISPVSLQFDQRRGGVDFTYIAAPDLTQPVPVSFYWEGQNLAGGRVPVAFNSSASGDNLSQDSDGNLIYTIPQDVNPGQQTFNLPGGFLAGAPADATDLLAVVDPKNTLGYYDPKQLELSSASTQLLLNVFPLAQGYNGTRPWSTTPLGQGQYPDQGAPIDTIGLSGCTLTALAMQLRYQGVTYNGQSPDPGLLNAELQNVSGAFDPDSKNRLTRMDVPIAAAGAIKNSDDSFGLQWHDWIQQLPKWDSASSDFASSGFQTLRDLLLRTGEPIMVGIATPSGNHDVLVTGLAGNNDFFINDPGTINTNGRMLSYYKAYSMAIRGYIGDAPDLSILDLAFVSVNANPSVIVTDSQGKMTGLNTAGQTLGQIPNSFTYVNGPLENLDDPSDDDSYTEFVDIYRPASGSYRISINGPSGQAYLLAASLVAPDGTVEPQQVVTGQTTDMPDQYDVAIDPSHALQPLLAVSTTQVTSDHPSGSVYGQTVTFTATVRASPSFTGSLSDSVQFQVDGSDFGSPVPVSGDSASMSIASLPTGTHRVTAEFSGDSVFAGSTSSVSLIVSPAPLTITADNKSMTYGGTMPALTASYVGLVNGDSPASLGVTGDPPV